MFFGSYTPDFSNSNSYETGGELAFDAYILWSPKIIPKDHNGVLVRLHNSSGIMFDETFMKHQVAEHTIKSQLSIEVFVYKGLGSALNIDRESFNISHPHYQILMKWLHQALRQVINKYKSLRKEAVAYNKKTKEHENETLFESLINDSLKKRGVEPLEKKSIIIIDDEKSFSQEDGYHIKHDIFEDSLGGRSTTSAHGKDIKLKAEAMFQILDSYNLLDGLTPAKQESLFADILKIIGFKGD